MDINYMATKLRQLERYIKYCEIGGELLRKNIDKEFHSIDINIVERGVQKTTPIMIIPPKYLNQIFKEKLNWFEDYLDILTSIKNRIEEGDYNALSEFDENINKEMWHSWLLIHNG